MEGAAPKDFKSTERNFLYICREVLKTQFYFSQQNIKHFKSSFRVKRIDKTLNEVSIRTQLNSKWRQVKKFVPAHIMHNYIHGHLIFLFVFLYVFLLNKTRNGKISYQRYEGILGRPANLIL